MSDSPQKMYRRNRTRWIAGSALVTLCTGTLGLLRDAGRLPPTVFSLSLAIMIASWVIAAMAWCTHCLLQEQRRRQAQTVAGVRRLLAEHNTAGWAAYAEQAENVIPINGKRM
jgi:hypothetical protein